MTGVVELATGADEDAVGATQPDWYTFSNHDPPHV